MNGDLVLQTAAGRSAAAAPALEYHAVAPMLIVLGAAVVGVLVEAFVPRRGRYPSQLVVTLGAVLAALVAVITLVGTVTTAMNGAVAVDGPALFLQGTLLIVALVGIGLVAERGPLPRPKSGPGTWNRTAAVADYGMDAITPHAATLPSRGAALPNTAGQGTTEVFPLLLFALSGLMLLPAANDLLTMFVALEVLSLPLYVLCGLARRRRQLSHEAALKYFLLGAFSSAFFLYGTALLYGATATVRLSGIAQGIAADTGEPDVALLGLALLLVGLLFKIGAVPFQAWVPDVYQGAPTPITAFMAAATKVAAVGALLRVLQVGVVDIAADWRPVVAAVAIATMAAGAIVAITQSDVKRMLAYSSVAHAGFVITALVSTTVAGISAILTYLFLYAIATLGVFAVISLVRHPDGREATDLADWAGLGRRNPWLGGAFTLLLLSMAGIPLTAGFVAKFGVFQAAAQAHFGVLVVVGVIASAVAAVFYLRVVAVLFFTETPPQIPVVVRPMVTSALVGSAAVATLLLGIFPQPLLHLAEHAGNLLH